jgi:hypothetical protein
MQIHTRTLNAGNSLVISASLGVYGFSYTINDSSSATLLGDITINGVASNAVTQTSGGATITSNSPTSPLQGITLTCVSGSVDVILTIFI